MTPPRRRRAAFLDRDGVLNVDAGYVFRARDFVWRDTAVAAVKWLNDHDILAFVVTNQSGVARGLYGEADVEALHAHMQAELAAAGAHIDAFRYCPHHPEGVVARFRAECACRKPGAGMLLDLLAQWRLDPADCRMFGDKPSDLEAGRAAGVPSVLVNDDAALIELAQAAFAA